MSGPQPESGLSSAQLRALDRLMDRVEDRLWGAEDGCHRVEAGASWAQVERSQIPAQAGFFWTRFNGMELAQGEVTVASLEEIPELTERFADRLREGDKVIGQRGLDIYVLPADPWEEGAQVVLVDSAKQRGPLASSLGNWILALLGEFSLIFDDEGEYRDGLFDEGSGELMPEVQRKILRRRLDLDPDGVLARFELGQLLREQGELRAAISELKKALRAAPDFCWSHFEIGRAYFEQADLSSAFMSFCRASELSSDNAYLSALCAAWAIRCIEDEPEKAEDLRAEVRSRVQSFASDQLEEARECAEDGHKDLALENIALGLAIVPTHLELLALRRKVCEG